jgi:transposase
MRQFIGCDSHRKYSVFVGMDENGKASAPVRVEHHTTEFRQYLASLAGGTAIAVEATGSWYWLVDELEAAGLDVRLVQPFAAKRMLGGGKKTDALDARALATLLRNGTLPEAWIPPAKLRDLRNLVRCRLGLRDYQTGLKCRVLAAVNRYGLREPNEDEDLFRGKGRVRLMVYVGRLPEQTREATIREWQIIDELETHIKELEESIRQRVGSIGWTRRLKTLPGVGEVLGPTIYLEIGDVTRFPTAQHLASYAGLVPSVHASGGKTFYGPTSKRANLFLRWAFVEAANVIVCHQKRNPHTHVVRLYQRLKAAKGHNKAAVAVARHLAESAWWILTKAQDYRPPHPVVTTVASSKNG